MAVSAIGAHELFYGAFKSRRADRNVALVDALRFAVLEFDNEDARQAGRIRALLARKGTPIGPYDVLIAGQAMARGLMVYPMGGTVDGRYGDHVLLAPPFIAGASELELVAQRLHAAIEAVISSL